MAYSPEEIKAFEAKERRIVKQAVLKATVDWQKGNPKLTVGNILTLADLFVAWVYNESPKKEAKLDTIQPVVPEPTVEQQQALEQVFKETNWTKEQVYSKFNKYPNMQNVSICIQKIKEL